MSAETFHDDTPPIIETGVEAPPPKYTSKYQPLLDWCDANPGQWGRAAVGGSYVPSWRGRGYEVASRSIDGEIWTYVRRPA